MITCPKCGGTDDIIMERPYWCNDPYEITESNHEHVWVDSYCINCDHDFTTLHTLSYQLNAIIKQVNPEIKGF